MKPLSPPQGREEMTQADMIRDQLERCGIEFLVWLPDSEVRTFYDSVQAAQSFRLVQVCHEEEAIGVYTGLYLTGKRAAILIQNSGLLHSLDALGQMMVKLEIPLLLLVGYRGYRDRQRGKQPLDYAVMFTEPVLDAMGIKHYLLDNEADVENITLAYHEALEGEKPVVVLIGGEFE